MATWSRAKYYYKLNKLNASQLIIVDTLRFMLVPPPIFILASPRSFTSLLCAMLGQHPELYGVPELNLFIAEKLEELVPLNGQRDRKLNAGLLRTVAQVYGGEQTILSVDMARRWLINRLQYNTGEIYLELCRKVAPLRIVDKSPIYSMKTEILHRIRHNFPDANYLHLLRHPRTQGQSVMNIADGAIAVYSNSIDYSTDPPTVDPQFLWYRMQYNILDFLSNVPAVRQMCLHGEDVLNDPRLYFEKICRWLNISWNDFVFDAILRPQDSPYACFGPYGADLGNDYNFLQPPIFKQRYIPPSKLEGSLPWRPDNKEFLPVVIKLAQDLGYQ